MRTKGTRARALHTATYGKVRKREKQVYHKNHKIYKGNGPKGSGHRAGEDWGTKKNIDPESKQRVYSKRGRSPSFDQGVNNYKVSAHNKALTNAKIDKHFKHI